MTCFNFIISIWFSCGCKLCRKYTRLEYRQCKATVPDQWLSLRSKVQYNCLFPFLQLSDSKWMVLILLKYYMYINACTWGVRDCVFNTFFVFKLLRLWIKCWGTMMQYFFSPPTWCHWERLKLEQKDKDCPRKALICLHKATEHMYSRSYSDWDHKTNYFFWKSWRQVWRKTQEMIYESGFFPPS